MSHRRAPRGIGRAPPAPGPGLRPTRVSAFDGYLIDELIKDRARELGDAFTVRRFFDELNATGVIPVSLIRIQLTAAPKPAR